MATILAGDIGGTKSVLALMDDASGALAVVREATFASQHYTALERILAEFATPQPLPALDAACFGVPGAVVDGRCETTNLPWVVEERLLSAELKTRVRLLNDLEATAYGMLHLEAGELIVLNAATRHRGNAAVIAAGTGLGEALLYWDGTRYLPIASEGGHGDFAPRSDDEIELLRWLQKKLGGHVSYERVLTGPGLLNIYEFLRDTGRGTEPDWLRAELQRGDPSAAIAANGLQRRAELCVRALDIFVAVYGAEAGNLALRFMAVGGVFVGGGIAPKLITALQSGTFMRAFIDKGRFADLLRGIEVSVAMNPRAALIGAAHFAWHGC